MAFPWFDCLLAAVPIGAYGLSRRFTAEPEGRRRTALRCAALFAVGLIAAAPFLTTRAVGTGEAYNYSLAVADGVAQMRSGVLPPLVGQTQYAFNGRIHPLRNAPYLFYLAEGFDLLTFRRLGAWQLQNLSLAFSLVAAVFTCYGGLRWGTGCRRSTALFFAGLYAWSPAVLASAYSANLFMTVHAAAFVPLALGGCFRQCRYPSIRADLVMAGALAATWLAHPPVAYWLTFAIVVARGLVFLRYPTWRGCRSLAAAVLLWLVLAGFVLVSVAIISSSVGFFNGAVEFGAALLPVLKSAFPGCLLPVARAPRATSVADFQLGYAGWAVLLLTAAALAWPRFPLRRKPRTFWALVGAIAVAALLLVLTMPIPGLTVPLWNHSPVSAQALTNIWPMQRVYLVALALAFFAAAFVLEPIWPKAPTARRIAVAAIALAAAWTAWEASAFIGRGFAMRWSGPDTVRSQLGPNIDLTVTSYSFLGTPPTFVNGEMDPLMEFRLLSGGRTQLDSNYAAALRLGRVVAQGAFRPTDGSPPSFAVTPQEVTLQPGRRYLLSFDFHTGPLPGTLFLSGPSTFRRYILPASGESEGFGMGAGHRRAISLWTQQRTPERVQIRFEMDPRAPRPPGLTDFADFRLLEIPVNSLPVRLGGLVPLRLTVDSPEANAYVDTPRRWLPGYLAVVGDRSIRPFRSPIWDVMVPVPQGRSDVRLLYKGSPLVHAAFWMGAIGWLGFIGWTVGRSSPFQPPRAWRKRRIRLAPIARRCARPLGAALLVGALAAAVGLRVRRQEALLGAVGPIRVNFYLPFHQAGQVQPIVTTGRPSAGTTVSLHYIDDGHVQVEADIWGAAYRSDPIAVDEFRRQNLVVDSSGLYPEGNPGLQALPAAERAWLRSRFRVELNGRLALDLDRSAYDSTADEVVIGRNAIGSSGMEPAFLGEILGAERLPIPRRWMLLGDESLRLRARFPSGPAGATQPVLALGPKGADGCLAVAYLAGGGLRFEALRPDGTVLESANRTVGAGGLHHLSIRIGRPPAGGSGPALSCEVDGKLLFGPRSAPPFEAPEEVEVGLAPRPSGDLGARFTGPELSVVNPTPPTSLSGTGYGPVRIIALLPTGRAGRQEPLVTTGRTGRGDFVYVAYAGDRHIRIGFDHWGVSGGQSDPIPVDYRRPHAFVISLGSLYPNENSAAWGPAPAAERRRLKSTLTVRLDGRLVYTAGFAAHPSTPAEVTAGLNRIGGSSCEPVFNGVLFSAERLGPW